MESFNDDKILLIERRGLLWAFYEVLVHLLSLSLCLCTNILEIAYNYV